MRRALLLCGHAMKPVIFLIFAGLPHCSTPDFEIIAERRILMDTYVAISVYVPRGSDQDAVHQDLDRVWHSVGTLDSLFSNYRTDSETAQINRWAATNPVKISPAMYALLARALEIAELSEGAFDVSVGGVIALWGFGHNPAIPPPDSLAFHVANVGARFMHLQPNDSTIAFDRVGLCIDVGGIAKGAIVDSMHSMLAALGYTDFMIDAGGDLRMRSSDLTAGRRNVWITHPRKADAFLARFKLDSGAVATSGDYERFFVQAGKRYHHILNPRTGMPASSAVSVTVLAPDAMTADAFATAFFVMGPEAALALAESLPGVEALIVSESSDGLQPHVSTGLASRLQFLQDGG